MSWDDTANSDRWLDAGIAALAVGVLAIGVGIFLGTVDN